MQKRCTTCNGTGKTFDLFAALFTAANWIPLNWTGMPYTRCSSCGGKGYIWTEWRPYSPRYRRR